MATRWLLGLLLISWSVSSFVLAEEPAPGAAPAPEEKMKTYQLVFVHETGKSDAVPENQARRIVTARNYYEEQLVFDGASLISGPIEDGGEIETVAVLDVETTKDAEVMFEHDPAMELGMMEVEIYPWSTVEGTLQKPAKERERSACYLGLLKRPSSAPSYSTEELERLQEGHLANLRKMHEAGDLVAAGPVDRAGDLRGILIFRTTDRERIEKLVAEDPAVKAGRLRLELYRWNVPKGVIPDKP